MNLQSRIFFGWLFLMGISILGNQMTTLSAASRLETAGSVRGEFLRLIDRPKAPLAPEMKAIGETGGLKQVHFSFATEQGQRVIGLLVKNTKLPGRRPVVISLHGTGGNKESQAALLERLAGLGFIAVAIDARYHGERAAGGKGAAAYVDAIYRAYQTRKEHPFLYDSVWDLLRLLDYLETLEDVDAKRIGMIGFSKGGMETYLTAAVDERVAAAVPCIGVQSFRWALENNAWQSRVGTFQAAVDRAAMEAGRPQIDAAFIREFYDRVAPGVYTSFDGPSMLPLVAPRPMLVINGERDPRTPLPGLMECITNARKAYQEEKAADQFEFLLQENTAHEVTPAARETAVSFFVKRLKP